MSKPIRIVITAFACVVAVFFLGLLKLASAGAGGAIIGILSVAIVLGIPWFAWWATGQKKAD